MSVLPSEAACPVATRSIVAYVEHDMLGSVLGINLACDRSGPGVVVFGEALCENVLKYVPHRQWVFSIPKRLRIYFMFDRKLLSKLSQCVWKVLRVYLKHAVCDEGAGPGAVIAIQSFGDFLGFHPHAHVLVTDGCFYGEGAFKVNPTPNPKDLEDLFRYEVFKMLKAEGKINDTVIENMMQWRHSGFNVYCGEGDLASQSRGVGKSGTLYYPCVIFTGAHELYSCTSIIRWYGKGCIRFLLLMII